MDRRLQSLPLDFPADKIVEFCRRWKVAELGLFGSVLRPDFGPESDVDVLVTFAPDSRRSLFDLVEMQEELASLFGRRVDLLTRPGVEQSRNKSRRKEILETARAIYGG